MDMNFNFDNGPKITNGFKTPPSYFDEFPKRLSFEVEKEVVKVIPIYSKTKNWAYIAAATVIVALCLTFINRNLTDPAQIDAATAENYLTIQSGIADQMADLLNEDDIKKVKIDMDFDDHLAEDILSESPDFEQYLIN